MFEVTGNFLFRQLGRFDGGIGFEKRCSKQEAAFLILITRSDAIGRDESGHDLMICM